MTYRLTKIICVSIFFLILLPSLPTTAQSTPTTTASDTKTSLTLPTTHKTATITAHIYGLGLKNTHHSHTITTTDAQQLLHQIHTYATHLAQHPNSPETKTLQHHILTYATQLGLIPANTFTKINNLPLLKTRILPSRTLGPKTQAAEWFCNYAAGGEGSSTPVIIFPRLTPILLLPIPRLFYRWNCYEGFASCGGLQSGTGFMALGEQTGRALGFWGVGFSIFLPPIMVFGIIGYALHCSVNAENIEYWPPNHPPDITPIYPLDNATHIPITTTDLSFHIDDYENEPMSYSITTHPDIGTTNQHNKPDGTYTMPITNLEGSETYTWTIQISDGENTIQKTYTFSTEPVAPIISNPTPVHQQHYIPLNLTTLSVYIEDPQQDLMTYSIETTPHIGSGTGTSTGNEYLTIPITNLQHTTTYTWYVNVTDGTHWKHKTYLFHTEPLMHFHPFNHNWTYRKTITIDHTKVTGTLHHYPLLIHTQDTDLINNTQPHGQDLLFMTTDPTPTRLYHEIESYDHTTGTLTAWIHLPHLPAQTNTTLHMYYGNPTCPSQQYPDAVWDTHYLGVWHLNEITQPPQDSTQHHNNATTYETQQDITGKINGANRFDGYNDYIHITSTTLDTPADLTIEAWARMDNTLTNNGWQRIYQKGTGKSGRIVELWVEDETETMGRIVFRLNKKTSSNDHLVQYQIPNFTYNTWYHYTAVHNDQTNQLRLYLNGEPKNQASFTNQIITGYTDHYIGNRNIHGDRPWNGILDEIRISDIPRSDAWIQTNYHNQHAPNNFYTIGPKEPKP